MSEFDWGLYPEAEAYLRTLVDSVLSRSETARRLAEEIEAGTSTDFFEWVDHLALPAAKLDKAKLLALHFEERERNGFRVFGIAGSTFFPLLAARDEELVLGPESLRDFCSVHFPALNINDAESAYQKVRLAEENGIVISAVGRRGSGGFAAHAPDDGDAYKRTLDAFRGRGRSFGTAPEGFGQLNGVIREAKLRLSSVRVADALFRAEREFWESKNSAARTQKARQDALGLGWGNADHLTFRSSRANFTSLVQTLRGLGMRSRERYHAGAQAGWGAQIMEHPESGEVVFADVDLGEEERDTDFSRRPLPERERLGTVGLWVALHGDSIFEAGLHHMAARFRFDGVREELERRHVPMMKPFSNFPFLKQAFTTGENWMPQAERVEALASRKLIDQTQRDKFLSDGAIGSHLENIERRQGFKGFNQDSVSVIIRATDPRQAAAKGA